MRRVGVSEPEAIDVGVRDAGVRKNFYRRERPLSGETIYDVEWSLGQAESAALPVVADIRARWPLTLEDRGKVAQFVALQHLRGPAFARWHEEKVREILAEARADPKRALKPHPGRTTADVIEEIKKAATSDSYRLIKMMKLVRSVGIVLGSMHWSLATFARGRLVTSDHPVVVWPNTGTTRRPPQPNDLSLGVLDTLEVCMPLGPGTLLLMSWLDEKSQTRPLAGEGRHVSTANSFVVANADAQWFHEVGVTPWLATGRRRPLSAELLPSYTPEAAALSQRRAKARQLANAETQRDLSNDDLDIVGEDNLPVGTT
jgi:hypothetical protein